MHASLTIHEVEKAEFDSFESADGTTWTTITVQTEQGKFEISMFRTDNTAPPELVNRADVQAREQLIAQDNARRGIR